MRKNNNSGFSIIELLIIVGIILILGSVGWLIYKRTNPTKLTIVATQGTKTTTYEVSNTVAAKVLKDFKQLKVVDTKKNGCTVLNIVLDGEYVFKFNHPNVRYYYLPYGLNKWGNNGICSPLSSGESYGYPAGVLYYPTAKIYSDFKQILRPPLPESLVSQ